MEGFEQNTSQELGGQKLLQAVATATGLPEHVAYEELQQILHLNGQNSGDVTLDSLRAAMIKYLETLNETMNAEVER